MCGVAGFVDRHSPAEGHPARLAAMLAAIRHRGPDGEGTHTDPALGLALGMRRLSIIDLAGGGQPIWNEAGTVGVVFNGEIYNYVELRDDLRKRGHRFRTESDTEVLVHAYEERGPAMVDGLRGMFAFCLLDAARGELFLARDHFGQKPLYYTASPGRFAFASEIKSLLTLPWAPRQPDPEALLDFASWLSVPAPRTHLRGVSKLPPGHRLTVKLDRPDAAEPERYWSYAPAARPDLTTPDAAAEALDAALEESVRLHLRSDVPVGVLLSGGLDSRAVTAFARAAVGGPIRTYSVGFAGGESELPAARQTAAELGTVHTEVEITPDDFLASLPEVAWHLDEPVGDPAAFAVLRVCRRASHDVKVLLGGEGSDELFAGYAGRYQGLLAAERRVARFRPLARLLPGPAAPFPASRAGRLLRRAGRSRRAGWVAGRVEGFPGDVTRPLGLTPDQLARLVRRQRELADGLTSSFAEPLDELTALDIRWQLAESLLLKADKMSMAASVELRCPFLDAGVAAVAARMAPAAKVGGAGPGKLALRRCLARRLAEPADRPKQGFPVPLAAWLRGKLREAAEAAVFAPNAAALGTLDRAAVRAAWDAVQAGDAGLAPAFYSLWLYEIWAARLRGGA